MEHPVGAEILTAYANFMAELEKLRQPPEEKDEGEGESESEATAESG